jgi:serine/threonine protein kinase
MARKDVNLEALARQGSRIKFDGRKLRIAGDSHGAVYESGSEGLVHLATDEKTGEEYRIKCFWEPDDERRQRSEQLIKLKLGEMGKPVADALGGAPFGIIPDLGVHTPFAVMMKNVRGISWKNLKERAKSDTKYPPIGWPTEEVRATWAYGLATAVMKMETHGFIHADLSPGNVMVTPAGADAGDMALVDFDEFFHPPYQAPSPGFRGSIGYAAPEIWERKSVTVGSDRLAMSILIQEFLVIGDPNISKQHGFGWSYDEDSELCSRQGEAHPAFAKRYPQLADLVVETLRASDSSRRPDPDRWRRQLQSILEKTAPAPRFAAVTLAPYPVAKAGSRLFLAATQKILNLSQSYFRIRASLERNPDNSIDVVVHSGAEVNIQAPGSLKWEPHKAGERVRMVQGLIVFDRAGVVSMQMTGEAL